VGAARRRRLQLPAQHRHEIRRMETIAHLVALAAEPDVLERLLRLAGLDPEREDALIGAAELARAGEHTKTVDPDGQLKSGAVLERQHLGAQLRRAVERD